MSGMERRTVGPRRDDVVETEIDDDISLFDPRSQEVYVLNGTASDVWRLCDGDHTADEIVALLAAAYATDADVIRDEVAATIAEFAERGLLAPEQAAQPG